MLVEKNSNSGQIILIILLVMAVGLTIGLSVAGRSLTDVRLSSKIEESNRAFSAAEAGIEQVLKQGVASATNSTGTIGDAQYNVNLNAIGGNSSQFTFPSIITQGDAQTVWLVGRNATTGLPDDTDRDYASSNIRICWWFSGVAEKPAVDISVFFKQSGVYKVSRTAYDPDNTRRSSNGFLEVTDNAGGYCNSGGQSFSYQVNLLFTSLNPPIAGGAANIPIALRIKPVYADTKIAVVPVSATLPEQGKNIVSTGTTGSGVARRWNVVHTYASPFDIFDYSVWSGNDLQK